MFYNFFVIFDYFIFINLNYSKYKIINIFVNSFFEFNKIKFLINLLQLN